jgi:hypothetical protein
MQIQIDISAMGIAYTLRVEETCAKDNGWRSPSGAYEPAATLAWG